MLTVVVTSGVEVDKAEELVTMVVVDSKDKFTIEVIASLVTIGDIGDIGDALVLAAAGVVVISCEFDVVAPRVEIFSPVVAISDFITQ